MNQAPDGARVVDIRLEAACTEAAPEGARCLPAGEVLGGTATAPVSFHALRWLLGTIGLSGSETVAIHPADDPRAEAMAALIYLAGQRAVVLLTGTPDETARGEARSFSREAVFTAPMRIAVLRLDPAAQPLAPQLTAFARGVTDFVAFAPDT